MATVVAIRAGRRTSGLHRLGLAAEPLERQIPVVYDFTAFWLNRSS